MQKMHFSLMISAEQYQSYYRGSAKFVRVQAEDGRTLKFPADRLQQFVTHEGIKGRFEIVFDKQHKLVSLKRI
jgi:ferritin